MKNVITLIMCFLFFTVGMAQTDQDGSSQMNIPEKTPELKALYEQARDLENNGTVGEINANRLAIKNAWQKVDPEIAALYKPIVTNRLPETVENIGVNGIYVPSEIKKRNGNANIPEWGTDQLLRNDFIDGLDMDIMRTSKDIYIATYENIIDFGGTLDSIFVYRSQDGGANFEQWKKVGVSAPMRKLRLITYDDGGADNYLVAYLVTETQNFQAWRWNTNTGAFEAQVIASDVKDFGVDTNFIGTKRTFATYQKTTAVCDNRMHSARSTAGNFGFDWIDETDLLVCGLQTEFAYGATGACYTTFTGASSGNLYGLSNPNNNDPGSWTSLETIIAGATKESLNPTIVATRKSYATDKVFILTSSRDFGTTDSFTGQGYRRENGADYVPFSYAGVGSNSISHIDTWMPKVPGIQSFETSYLNDDIDNSDPDKNRSRRYDGSSFILFEQPNDDGRNVYDGFSSVVSQTPDGNPCMAFAGRNNSSPVNLYFDAQNSTLAINENSLDGFKFYPNPVNSEINLSTNGKLENVAIFSLLGQQVSNTKINLDKTAIDVSALTSGVYLMKVEIDGQTGTYKFIKQ